MSVNIYDFQVRCVGMVLVVVGLNLGGFVGINFFKQEDVFWYVRGFFGVLCLYGGSIVVIFVMMGIYWYENKCMVRKLGLEEVIDVKGVDVICGDGSKVVVKN